MEGWAADTMACFSPIDSSQFLVDFFFITTLESSLVKHKRSDVKLTNDPVRLNGSLIGTKGFES